MAYTFTRVSDARRYFKEHIQPLVEAQYSKRDTVALNEAWNNWTDDLYKNGEISYKAYDTWCRTP